MGTNSEFFKKKKASEVLYDEAIDALDAINPDIRQSFEKEMDDFKRSLEK